MVCGGRHETSARLMAGKAALSTLDGVWNRRVGRGNDGHLVAALACVRGQAGVGSRGGPEALAGLVAKGAVAPALYWMRDSISARECPGLASQNVAGEAHVVATPSMVSGCGLVSRPGLMAGNTVLATRERMWDPLVLVLIEGGSGQRGGGQDRSLEYQKRTSEDGE